MKVNDSHYFFSPSYLISGIILQKIVSVTEMKNIKNIQCKLFLDQLVSRSYSNFIMVHKNDA